VKQDLPPPGGYAAYVYKSQVKPRGPSGVAIMAGGLAVMGIGFYFVSKGNQNRRELVREQKMARIHLLPLLQAEQDRLNLKRLKENLETEKAIMKDVEGWDLSQSVYNVYNTDRWVPPRDFQLEKL